MRSPGQPKAPQSASTMAMDNTRPQGRAEGLRQTLLNTVGRAREGGVEELRPLCLALRVCVAGEEQGAALGQRWQGRALAGGPGAGQLWP